jgi:hypothetical protein
MRKGKVGNLGDPFILSQRGKKSGGEKKSGTTDEIVSNKLLKQQGRNDRENGSLNSS